VWHSTHEIFSIGAISCEKPGYKAPFCQKTDTNRGPWHYETPYSDRLLAAALPSPVAILRLSQTDIHFTEAQNRGQPVAQSFTVSNIGGASLAWTVDEEIPWLDVSSRSGSGDAIITVTVDPAGLLPGSYLDTIRVSGVDAQDGQQIVQVSFFVAGQRVYIPAVMR